MSTRMILLGGFLGAGKSTALLHLAQRLEARRLRTGIITNDQAEDLVDTALFRDWGLATREVAGGCFCCRFDDFVARADELLAATRPAVILAEPVGSCTDLVATVLRPIERLHGHRFSISPYAVLVDPLRLLRMFGGEGRSGFSEKVTYVFRLQQQEAELLVLSKVDLLDALARARARRILAERFPRVDVVEVSSVTGEGLDALLDRLLAGTTHVGRPTPDVDYDLYAAGEAELGWLNAEARLRAEAPIDVDAALVDLAEDLRRGLGEARLEVAHAKLLLRGEQHTALANLVDASQPAVLSQSTGESAASLVLVANLRARGAPDQLEAAFRAALAGWQERHALEGGCELLHSLSPPRPVPTHMALPSERAPA